MSHQTLLWAALAADVIVKATALLGAAWIAARLARRAPAAARHLIWMVALGALMLLPLFEIVAPRTVLFSIPEPPPAPLPAAADVTDLALDAAAPQPPPPSPSVNLVVWVGGAWIGGCGAVLLSALAGWTTLRRIKAKPIPLPEALVPAVSGRRVRLAMSREGRPPSALTWGTVRPIVLLPRMADEWPSDRLETVLLHEFEHIRRWDAASQLVATFTCGLYWFHPGVWLAARAARNEAEAATDDAVLRRGVRPSAYAHTLMEVAAEISRYPRLASTTGVAFMKRSQIEARLRAILDGRTRRAVTRREKFAAAMVASVILVPLAFVRAAAVAPVATSPEQADPSVLIDVHPHPSSARLKKKLAAQQAHHRRALAALAKQRAAAKANPLARADMTADQLAQAAKAGQLAQALPVDVDPLSSPDVPSRANALLSDAFVRSQADVQDPTVRNAELMAKTLKQALAADPTRPDEAALSAKLRALAGQGGPGAEALADVQAALAQADKALRAQLPSQSDQRAAAGQKAADAAIRAALRQMRSAPNAGKIQAEVDQALRDAFNQQADARSLSVLQIKKALAEMRAADAASKMQSEQSDRVLRAEAKRVASEAMKRRSEAESAEALAQRAALREMKQALAQARAAQGASGTRVQDDEARSQARADARELEWRVYTTQAQAAKRIAANRKLTAKQRRALLEKRRKLLRERLHQIDAELAKSSKK